MALPLVSRAPQCLSCVRCMPSLGESLRSPAMQQIRGKKKVAKVPTINVKLRTNVVGFGRKGSIVPVPRGTMRNNWLPRKMAEYQTMAQLKELGDVVIERDFTYGTRQEKERIAQETKEAAKKEARKQKLALKAAQEAAWTEETFTSLELPTIQTEIEAPAVVEVQDPEHVATIMERLLPSHIEFYRTPLPPPSPPRKLSPSLASSSALSAAARSAAIENAEENSQKPTQTRIHGSVSRADIAANLKAILAEDVEGERLVLSPEDISFVEQVTEYDKDRLKCLGTFTIDIKVGTSDTVQRTIIIKAQS